MLDYCIVGGGVLGCAIGKTLLEENPDLKIEILEQFAAPGQGNTIRSNAAYRDIFDTTTNIKLASSTIKYYKAMELEGHDFGRREIGYLFLLTEEQFTEYSSTKIDYNDKKVSFFEFLDEQQIKYKIYGKQDLENKFPVLKLDPDNEIARMIEAKNIAYGFLGQECGNFAPDLVVKHYYNKYRKLGGNIKFNCRVTKIKLGSSRESEFDPEYIPKVWDKTEVKSLEIVNSEGEIEYVLARNFILATGAWINQLLDPIGARSLIKPKKRQLFTINNLPNFIKNDNFDTEENVFPFLILPTGGVFIKPLEHANCIVVGTSDVIGRKFEQNYSENYSKNQALDDPKAENDFFIYNILPVLQSYFPDIFDNISTLGTAGHYSYSVDKYPVIDKVEGLPNLYFVGGASGSGIMKADSIARITTALLREEQQATLFSGDKIKVSDFGIKYRNLPDETLVL